MQNTNYVLDGHKLHWHPDRVAAWMRGERIAPLHIDVGLSRGCNIRCHYCYGKLQGNRYQAGAEEYFPREPLLRYMREAGEVGVRSMALIGESEPLLNPHVYEAIVTGHKAGVDIGLGTNGLLLDTGAAGQGALEHLTYIRFNISAASQEAYQRLHGSPDFPVFLQKVGFVVAEREKRHLPVTVGMQMVLTPQDADQAIPLARLGRELGVDYLQIKQCADTQDNALGIYDTLEKYDGYHDILRTAQELSTDTYRVIPKWRAICGKGKREFGQCLGAPFLLYSAGDGRLYSCGLFFNYRSEEFLLGNLVEKGFREIVESDHYWQTLDRVKETMSTETECYASCRTNEVNKYLWMLRHPPAHVNFI